MSEVEHGLVIGFPNQPVGTWVMFIFANRPFSPRFLFSRKIHQAIPKGSGAAIRPPWVDGGVDRLKFRKPNFPL